MFAPDTLRTIAWGLFCANSWTWCVGMWLPAILIVRHGWPGFLAFAVPNLIGCVAFGYVIGHAARSRAMIDRHGPAMTLFSIVTVAFHLFFITAFAMTAGDLPRSLPFVELLVAGAVFLLALRAARMPDRAWLTLSTIIFAGSLGAMIITAATASFSHAGMAQPRQVESLMWLSPVMIFGFLLCPYLDLTFHRAVQQSPSRHAFAVFGACFAAMIAFTAVQTLAPSMRPWFWIGHVTAQTIFTAGAHLREIRLVAPWRLPVSRPFVVAMLPLAALLAYVGAERLVISEWEPTYLRMLVFYGLAFPAYVLLLVIALGRGTNRRVVRLWFLGLVGFALPFYEAGFIGGRTWLLAIPLAVMALAAVALQNRYGQDDAMAVQDRP